MYSGAHIHPTFRAELTTQRHLFLPESEPIEELYAITACLFDIVNNRRDRESAVARMVQRFCARRFKFDPFYLVSPRERVVFEGMCQIVCGLHSFKGRVVITGCRFYFFALYGLPPPFGSFFIDLACLQKNTLQPPCQPPWAVANPVLHDVDDTLALTKSGVALASGFEHIPYLLRPPADGPVAAKSLLRAIERRCFLRYEALELLVNEQYIHALTTVSCASTCQGPVDAVDAMIPPNSEVGSPGWWACVRDPYDELRGHVSRWSAFDVLTCPTKWDDCSVLRDADLGGHVCRLLLRFEDEKTLQECTSCLSQLFGVHVMSKERQMIGAARATEQWTIRTLSNYGYLLLLNDAASRSRFDMDQYPVLPWVLHDLAADSPPDPDAPDVMRDLSVPIAKVLCDGFAQRMQNKYEGMQEDFEHLTYGIPIPRKFFRESMLKPLIPKTYSMADSVGQIMARRAPEYCLLSADGGFDDRMWTSFRGFWTTMMGEGNGHRFFEAMPEFYELPRNPFRSFLVNIRGIPLVRVGRKESVAGVSGALAGVHEFAAIPEGDVTLPKWTCGSPETFVKVHAELLESDWVSAHLHHWLDLVFGCKQRGTTAEQAENVYHPISYEGAVLDDVGADVRRRIDGHVHTLGQIPVQLFRTEHPRRETATTA